MPKQWDWDKVTRDLCAHIAEGGTREGFAKKKSTPSMVDIFTHIGLDDERTARVQAAYRFRAESAADKVIDIREQVESGELEPNKARLILSSLQEDIKSMTGLATRAPQAKQSDASTSKGLRERIEEAVERKHADD